MGAEPVEPNQGDTHPDRAFGEVNLAEKIVGMISLTCCTRCDNRSLDTDHQPQKG